MIDTTHPGERAYLVALDVPGAAVDAEASLDELEALVAAAGGTTVGRTTQRRRSPDRNTWIGKGKVDEVARERARLAADVVICDDELTPTQQRTLEGLLDVRVIDRSAVILDIFARHAQSREGRVQVELAQLEYRLPRLAGSGREMSRLGGGINTRGPGETKLESDRQVIRRRIQDLKGRLKEVTEQRERSRRSRSADGLFLAALVGYTNVGKSTLLNVLSGAEVLVADQPFATLDPTTRRATLANGTVVLLSDTVGFVNKLPPALVTAFKATLEELDEADLLVHVADASDPALRDRISVVDATLASLGLAERPTLLVLNKIDRAGAARADLATEVPDAVLVSAHTGEGLDALRERIASAAGADWKTVRVTLPHRAGGLVQRVRERGALHRADYVESGIVLEADVPAALAAELRAEADAGRRERAAL